MAAAALVDRVRAGGAGGDAGLGRRGVPRGLRVPAVRAAAGAARDAARRAPHLPHLVHGAPRVRSAGSRAGLQTRPAQETGLCVQIFLFLTLYYVINDDVQT